MTPMKTHLPHGSVGFVETKRFTFAEPPHEMPMDIGGKLGPITLAYETYGKLNREKSNAVLVQHAFSGSAHAAGFLPGQDPSKEKPGWWDFLIGTGRSLDTEKYFVICSNVIGSCYGSTGPSSVDPKTGRPYGLSFPVVSVGDMVAALRRVAGDAVADRVKWEFDPAIDRIVATWPANFAPQLGPALGMRADADFESIVRAYIGDDMPRS